MIKTSNAITLIALIITIIVLLILAGVTINMVLGDNGLINKSKTSVAKYENAQEKENIALAGYETEIDNVSRDTVTISSDEYTRLLNASNALNYSAIEKVVGTWTDGKTLYQKSFTGTTSSNSCSLDNLENLNIDKCISIVGCIDSGFGFMPINYSKQDYVTMYYHKELKTLEYRSGADGYAIVPYYVTIQYTKTTD